MEQIIIGITGLIAAWLTQQKRESWKKYACLVGAFGQPFWIYFAYTGEHYGILVMSVFYSGVWVMGIYNNWIKG